MCFWLALLWYIKPDGSTKIWLTKAGFRPIYLKNCHKNFFRLRIKFLITFTKGKCFANLSKNLGNLSKKLTIFILDSSRIPLIWSRLEQTCFFPNPPTCESKKSFSTPLRIRKAFSFFEYFKDGLNFQCLFDFRNRLVKAACFGAAGLSHIRTSATALRPDKWGYFLD